jgi:hypothetical protein
VSNFNQFVGYNNIIPLLAPVDIADTETVTGYVNLKGAHNFAFFAYFGLLTSATAADTLVITVEAATLESGTEAQVDFYYRKAAAAGANTWAAIASASVVTLAASLDDGVALWIEVDPDVLAASDYKYVRLRMVPTDLTACLPSVVGVINPRYRMTTYISATASASA